MQNLMVLRIQKINTHSSGSPVSRGQGMDVVLKMRRHLSIALMGSNYFARQGGEALMKVIDPVVHINAVLANYQQFDTILVTKK